MAIDVSLIENELETINDREASLLKEIEDLKQLREPLMRKKYIGHIHNIMSKNKLSTLPIKKLKLWSNDGGESFADEIVLKYDKVYFVFDTVTIPAVDVKFDELSEVHKLLSKFVFIDNILFTFEEEKCKCSVHIIYTNNYGKVDMGTFGALLGVTADSDLEKWAEIFKTVKTDK